jgi:hypothetical protein
VLGKGVLMSKDGFPDAGQVVTDPAGMTKGIVNLVQIRQHFGKVSGARRVVRTLRPFASKTMRMCRRFGNL